MKQSDIIDVANAPKPSDAALFASYKESKDRSLIAELFRSHMSLVFGVCMVHFGEKNEAQQATMEVFDRLLDTAEMPDLTDFRTFLFALTDQHCLQRKRGEKPSPIRLSAEEVDQYKSKHTLDSEGFSSSDLDKVLKKQSEPHKSILTAFYKDQKSYGQIAKEQHTSIPAVKSLLQDAKKAFES